LRNRINLAPVRRTAEIGLAGALATGLALVVPTVSVAAPSSRHQAMASVAEPPTAIVEPNGLVVPVTTSDRKATMPGLVDPRGAAGPPPDVRGWAGGGPCPNAPTLTEADARALVLKVAQEENFYPDFVLAVATVESRFKANALSDKGAFGLMQLMPATAETFKVNLCEPHDNVRGGIRFLRSLHQKYGNPFHILAAYNAGEVAVQQAKGVPPLSETVRFIASVMNEFYDWPRVEATQGGGRRTAATTRGAASAEPKGRGEGRWVGGFVMHLDREGQDNAGQ
jgi:soluble lytic murein transglycosylase-like protein